jgi:glyoxylase-like metal-dependent hydrolase (beta-lactamase superfamily II)
MEIKHLIVGPLLTNCYLLISKGEAAVIDPGGGAKAILKEIEESKAKLKYIILTHGHWDHTLSVLKIREKTGAKILIHEAEKEFVKFAAIGEPRPEGREVDEFLKEDSEIKIGDLVLKVIHTPGHTKGSICLTGENEIFTGDTIFKDGYGRTDLKGGSQKDLENSLEKLKKFLKPGMKVYPGHGETFEY